MCPLRHIDSTVTLLTRNNARNCANSVFSLRRILHIASKINTKFSSIAVIFLCKTVLHRCGLNVDRSRVSSVLILVKHTASPKNAMAGILLHRSRVCAMAIGLWLGCSALLAPPSQSFIEKIASPPWDRERVSEREKPGTGSSGSPSPLFIWEV